MNIRIKEMINFIRLVNEFIKDSDKRFLLCEVEDIEELIFLKDYISLSKDDNGVRCETIVKPVELVDDFILSMLQFNGSTIIIVPRGIAVPDTIRDLCND